MSFSDDLSFVAETKDSVSSVSNTTKDKKLHIAMFIDAYIPMRNGTVESTRRFAEGMRKRGHKVTIVSTGHAAADKVITSSIYIPYFTPKVIKPMQMELGLPTVKTVARFMRTVDVIHVQLPFYMGWWAARFANLHGIPCAATHHVQAEWLSNAGITWHRAVTFCYKLFLKTYQRAACLICPSKMGLDDLERYGFKGSSKVISNGVTPMFHPLPETSFPQYKDYFVILSVGRLAAEKFHDITVKAIAKSKYAGRIKLVIAGTGPQKAKLQQLASALPNPVDFVLLKPEELVPYYNRADLFVHSAKTEMEGMACLEAIACGAVPVIASGPLSASDQFALDERSKYPFGGIASLANKIDSWVEDPDAISSMRPRYVAHAKQFSFENSLDSLEDLYYKLAAKQPIPPDNKGNSENKAEPATFNSNQENNSRVESRAAANATGSSVVD